MQNTADPQSPSAPIPLPRRRRRWWLWLPIGLLGLAAVLPYLLNIGPIRRGILRVALVGQGVSVDVERAALGWFSPIDLGPIHVRKADAEAAVTIEAVHGDQALWRHLLAPGTLGHFLVAQPLVRLELADPEAGLIGLLRKEPTNENEENKPEEDSPDGPRRPLALVGSLEVQQGRLLVSGGASGREWSLGDLSVQVQLQRAADAPGSTLVVEPGTPLDHVELSPEVCNDLLKFVAPHLADVAQADGSFSLYVHECMVPLAELRRMRVRGKLVIHAAEIGPGALIRTVAEAIGVEHLATAPSDTSVEFSVIGEQVLHEALQFQLGKLRVLTRGTVGFDQSLDLQIEVPMPAHLLKEGPLRTALTDQALVLPVRGTLKKPQVDAKALGQSGVQVLKTTLQAFFPKDQAVAQGDVPAGSPAPMPEENSASLDDETVERRLVEQGIEVGEELLESLRKHRAERQAEREAAGTPTLWEQWRSRRQANAEAAAQVQDAQSPQEFQEQERREPATDETPRPPRPRLRDRFQRPARKGGTEVRP